MDFIEEIIWCHEEIWDDYNPPICDICNSRIDFPPLIRIHIRIEQPPFVEFNNVEEINYHWDHWGAESNDSGYESSP